MKTIHPINLKAYKFKELNEKSQNKALNDETKVWMVIKPYDEKNKGNFEKAIDKANDTNTPWFLADYIYECCKDELMNALRDALFYEDGEQIPLIYQKDKVRQVI